MWTEALVSQFHSRGFENNADDISIFSHHWRNIFQKTLGSTTKDGLKFLCDNFIGNLSCSVEGERGCIVDGWRNVNPWVNVVLCKVLPVYDQRGTTIFWPKNLSLIKVFWKCSFLRIRKELVFAGIWDRFWCSGSCSFFITMQFLWNSY